MKKNRKMTLAHAVIIALFMFVLLFSLQTFGVLNLSLFGYNLCSWIGLIALSITIAVCFNTQPGIIQFLIFVFIATFLLALYAIIAQINPIGIPYMNALGIGICGSIIICVIYAIRNTPKSGAEKDSASKLDDPKRLIQAIFEGIYSSRDHLFRFYLDYNYISKKYTFIDLLNTICDVCKELSSNDKLQSQIREKYNVVYSIVKPILEEERETEFLSGLNGKERSTLLTLHKTLTKIDNQNRERTIHNISYLADVIVSLRQKVIEENKRNTQALTISIVGILLTIIFSLLSFLVADNYSALHAYMDYILKQ